MSLIPYHAITDSSNKEGGKLKRMKRERRDKFSVVKNLLLNVIGWLVSYLDTEVQKSDFSSYLLKLQKVYNTNGMDFTIKYNKLLRSCVMNYLSDNPERPSGVGLTRFPEQLPYCLGPLLKHIRKAKVKPEQKQLGLRLVLTGLHFTRALKTKPDPDFEPILAPPKEDLVNLDPELVSLF